MIYIFEDMENDNLSKFFREAYPKEVSNKFVYTNGNGNIIDTVNNMLTLTDEEIIVFLDYYPTNDSIFRIYRNLCSVSGKNNYRILVLPIVCSEFYILKLLDKSNMITDKSKADIAFNFELFDSVLCSNEVTEKDINFCTTFEKYCKLVSMKWVEDCAKTNGTQEYYKEDCICNTLRHSACQKYELSKKAIDYVSQYPYVPEGSYALNIKHFTIEEMWDIHRQLVEMFNAVVDKLKPIDSSRKYKKIKTIK